VTLAELRQEVAARGFDFVSSTRLDRWINQAYTEICNYAPWPFLETSTTKTNAQAITDLGSVLSVYDAATKSELHAADRDWIKQNISNDLTITGTACYWYLTSSNTFNVYPVDTATFTIYYLEVPNELDSDTDEPLIPDRFQDLIVDRAAIKAYKDNDQYEAVSALRAEYNTDLEQMGWAFFGRNLQEPEQVNRIASHEWA